MKHFIAKIGLLLAGMLFITNVNAQDGITLREAGWWTVGINGGWAYQQSDVKSQLNGYGFGLTVAKNVYYRPNNPLSFDLRGRFLYANTYGLDGSQTTGILNNTALNGTRGVATDYTEGNGPGFVYANYNTNIVELSVEGVLHLNRLRERTNWDISLYGGLGIDWYRARINALGNDDNNYFAAYTDLDPNAKTSTIRNSLVDNILDDSYETNADGFGDEGKINWMPSFGVEAYYWLTPRFAAGFGHRATWARGDLLDGQQWDIDNQVTAENDIYHYTSLGLKWIVNEGSRQRLRPPVINIVEPLKDPYNSVIPDAFLRAKIENVRDDNQVTVRVNGRTVPFDMIGQNLTANFPLREGRNEVDIFASNDGGSDQASIVINYSEEEVSAPAPDANSRPEITMLSPSTSPFDTDRSQYTVKATIINVDRDRDIRMTVNGSSVSNFDFDNRSGRLIAGVNLQEGRNDIVIEAKNRVGTTTENATIFYKYNPQSTSARPSVNITSPRNNYTTQEKTVRVEATLDNVKSSREIQYLVNGRRSDNFKYDSNRGVLTSDVYLNEANNKVEIRVSNDAGQDSDEVAIRFDSRASTGSNTDTYTPPPPNNRQKPVIRITSTGQPSARDCSTTIQATISNVSSPRDVSFKVNGRRVSNFEFDPSRGLFRSNIALAEGNNQLLLEARNAVGRSSDTATARCDKNTSSTSNNTDTNTNNNTSRKPTINITSPSRQSTTTKESRATVKATVENVSSKNDINYIVNGKRVTNFSFSGKQFSATTQLNSGNNDIIIKVKNRYGVAEDGVGIRYIKSIGAPSTKKPPLVTITSPRVGSTNNANVTLKASIGNVSNKNDISVILNNKPVTGFTFNNKEVVAQLKLQSGTNKVVVKAKNSDGTEEDSKTITLSSSMAKPTVSITSPSNNSTVQTDDVTLKATVRNATKGNIVIVINGKSNKNFSMSGSTLTAKTSLKKGKNNIVIKATNSGGTTEESVGITYSPKVRDVPSKPSKPSKPSQLKLVPIVTINSASEPTTNPLNPGVARSTVLASIKNIDKEDQISFTVNGKVVNNFEFNPKTGAFKSVITLQRGDNKIVLKARNENGTKEATKTVKY